jgi:phospholipid transport system substrate-binding protein
MLRKFLLVLSSVFCFMAVSASAESFEQDPKELVVVVSQKTFEEIGKNKENLADIEFAKKLIEDQLLPYIDAKYASYKVIGVNLKKTTEAQRDRFTKAFTNYIVLTYATALKKYTSQTLEFPQDVVDKNEKIASVRVIMKDKGAPDIELIFKLRKNTKTGLWKVYDMVAEGISLLSAKQSELSGLIRDKGIDEVSKMLENHEIKEQ